MASRLPSVTALPPQLTRPDVGIMSAAARRNSVVLPAPWGPMTTVGAPGSSESEMRSRIATPRTTTEACSNTIGRSLAGARIASSGMDFAEAPHAPGDRVDRDDEREQDDPKADRQRQVALGSLERDGRRHHPGETLDVAAHDHDGAHFGRGAAEAGQHCGEEAEAGIPDQRRHAPGGREAQGGELIAGLDPETPE